MALKPLGDRVIVKADEAEAQTASGLYLASESKEKPQTGTVIAVGEGKIDKDGNKFSRLATRLSTASTAGPKSATTARTCSSSVLTTFTQSANKATERKSNQWQKILGLRQMRVALLPTA